MSHKVVITGISTSQLPKLTARETEDMLIRIKNGELELREKFLEGNMRLVLSMVQRFRSDKSSDDLFQVGMLGLIKALDNFDTSVGVCFSTYAVPMILGEMRRFLREGTALKVGRYQRDIAYRAMQARDKLELNKVNEVTLTEIANEICVPYREVVSALDAISEPVSLFEAAYNDGDESVTVIERISDEKTPEDTLNNLALREEIEKLPQKERQIIDMRYFLGKTQMEISSELNISQAQVSRLEKNAISRLKEGF